MKPVGRIVVATLLVAMTIIVASNIVNADQACCGIPTTCTVTDVMGCRASRDIECECIAVSSEDSGDFTCCKTGAADDNEGDCQVCDDEESSGCSCSRDAEGNADCQCDPLAG